MSESRKLRLRQGDRGDTPAIVARLNDTFRTPIDGPTWEWYALGNPNGPSRIYVAESDDDPVAGVVAFSPIFLRIDKVRVCSDYAHHLALKPAYRDTFSYLALMQYALKAEAALGVKMAIGPPNPTAYPIHKKLTRWVEFGSLRRMRKLSPQVREHECRQRSSFPDSFDSFYDQVSRRLAFCLEKNAAWMNWRFCRRPGSPYTIYTTGPEDAWTGYIILKSWQEESGYRKAHIMDLHAVNEAAFQELLKAAESYADGYGEVNLWAVQGYPYRRWLEAWGFTTTPADHQPLLARPFNAFMPVYPEGDCCLSYGDGDSQY